MKLKLIVAFFILVLSASAYYFFKIKSTPQKIYKDVPHLVITDIEEGKGDLVTIGKKVWVHYTLHILEDKMIDDTHGKEPVVFRVGEQKVFSGLETGHAVVQRPLFFNTLAVLTCDKKPNMVVYSAYAP